MRYLFIAFVYTLLALLVSACQINQEKLAEAIAQATDNSAGGAPNNSDTVLAIKQALQQGVDETVFTLGQTFAFSRDARIKIPLPNELERFDTLLRKVGQDKYADEFVSALNRAAEQATPVAKDVFYNSIKQMSIADAIGIMRGEDNAATVYFQKTASSQLTTLFKPIVSDATNAVGVTNLYKQAVDKLALVGYQPEVYDLDAYVTDKTLAGIFLYISEQEKSIRDDPAKAVSQLVERVFDYYR